MPTLDEMVGRTYGRWAVLARVSDADHRKLHCRCACGTERVVDRVNLTSGASTSCGCRRRQVSAAQSGPKAPRYVEHAGRRLRVAAWAREVGLSEKCLRSRLDAGWDPGEALTRPTRKKSRT